MYPLKSIIDFLLAGVGRIPDDERVDALLAMFAGLLPGMSPAEIIIAREQVIVRFWTEPGTAESVVDLMDGHLALRSLLESEEQDGSTDNEI